VVTIGRDESNDVVIANPQVSRLHATLSHSDGSWSLISIGRHGTVVGDRLISEFELRHQTVFQLGAGGPMLRFDLGPAEQRGGATLDNIDPDTISMLAVDESRKQHEVDLIAGNDLFRELQERSRQMRKATGNQSPTGLTEQGKLTEEM
jgi:pSer/pThr/pTyr-binding forkhead associated (FHA) protein